MNNLKEYILEKFKITKDIPLELTEEEETAYKKLKYVLKKFFGTELTLYEDKIGGTTHYRINPDTIYMENKWSPSNFVKYCKKIPDVTVEENQENYTAKIGLGNAWIRISVYIKSFRGIEVSQVLYDRKIFRQDNVNIPNIGFRGWK